MKEIVVGDPRPARLAMPPDVQAGFAAFARSLSARSQIVWGEHCSECAFPSCYAACAFYEPKPGDLHCRRFEDGIQGVAAPGAEELKRIRFRRWGKLEGRGPAALRPIADARRRERTDAVVARVLDAAPAPFSLKRNLAWRWNSRKARPEGSLGLRNACFVVECWSPSGRPFDFTLTFLGDGPAGGMFQAHFQAGGGYGRHATPAAEIAAAVPLDQPWRVQIEPIGEAAGVEVVFGLTDFVTDAAARQAAVPQPKAKGPPLAKVLVWDLDETLWTGTLAEDGPGGVTPLPEAVAAIRALDERGVLQSIASKNDPDEVQLTLKRFGLDGYFLHPQVGWGPKSQSVARIAQLLDLGLDSFVFIDDQPFERAEVQASHPLVRALPHTAVAELMSHDWFAHPVTAEGRARRASYQAEARRSEAFEATGAGDYLEFLRKSGITLQVSPLGPAEAPRVHELSQRTNQLNFTGAKLSLDAVTAMTRPEAARARWTLRCLDRFGDYGLIGFVELDLQAGVLLEFFMSCRVQRKRVEHAVFAHMAEALRARGHGDMQVRFRATERNSAAVRMLTELGFARGEDDEGGWSLWRRTIAEPFADSDIVRLNPPSSKAA